MTVAIYETGPVTPEGGVSVSRIAGEYARRKVNRSPLIEACNRITKVYNNDIVLPMPEIAAGDAAPVANLISAGIDQHAQRIADLLPDIQCPPVKPGDNASMKRAAQRRRACYGYWDQNHYELGMRKRARWLVAYASAPVWIRPDKKLDGPRWELISPLHCYPSDDDALHPDDVILAATRNVAWLQGTYPDLPLHTIQVSTGQRRNPRQLYPDDIVEIVQWLDANETVTIATGVGYAMNLEKEAEYGVGNARITNLSSGPGENSMWAACLLRTPNRAGITPVVNPGRISLDVRRGQFDDAIDLYRMQAVLAAMEVNAIANGIWPDQYLVPGGPGEQPQVVTPANGRLGVMGRVSGGTIVTTQMQPGVQTPQAIDRLERAIRLQGQIPSDFSGESPSNIRTARRGNQVLSEAVDFTLGEHQDILARCMQVELDIAAAIDVAYHNHAKSFYVGWKGSRGRLDYTPAEIWNDDRTIHVGYAKVGADREQLVVEAGQLIGTDLISKDSARRMHPDVEDPDREAAQIIAEKLDAAALEGILIQAQQGGLPVVDIARLRERIEKGESLEAAIIAQQKEAQERQAAQVAAQAPEAQPGLAVPGAGAEASAAPSIAGPTQDVQNLADLIRNIRTPAVAAGA